MSPYYSDTNLSFAAAQQTLQLSYRNTVLYTERNDVQTSGLDALAIRPAQSGFPNNATSDPPLPIPSDSLPHLTVDAEGLVLNDDNTLVHHILASSRIQSSLIDSGRATSMVRTYIGSIPRVA